MRRQAHAYVTLAFLGFTLALAGVTPALAADGPQLVVAEPMADLGKVTKGDKVRHTFRLLNEGTAPLLIEKVEPACHCTVVEFDATIPAGGEAKLVAELDTMSLNGTGTTALRVHSNDPQSPAVLTLSYEIVIRLQARPGYARWTSTQGEQEGTIGNTIWSSDGAEWKILRVDSPLSYLRSAFRPATGTELNDKAGGSQWRIDLTLDAQAPIGAVTGMVLVHTDHPEQKVIPLPISGFMRPVVFVFPEKGDFGTLDAARLPVRASFKFTNFATEPIAVTGAEANIAGATMTVEPVEEGRVYNVKVTLPAGMPAGPFTGKVAIRTDSPKAPVVEVPVEGVIETGDAAPGE